MITIMGLAIGLIIAGLVMVWLHTNVKGVLAQVVYYAGVLLVIVGLILFATPILIWVNKTLRDMLAL